MIGRAAHDNGVDGGGGDMLGRQSQGQAGAGDKHEIRTHRKIVCARLPQQDQQREAKCRKIAPLSFEQIAQKNISAARAAALRVMRRASQSPQKPNRAASGSARPEI